MLKFKLTPHERKYFQMWRNVCIAKCWKQGDDSKRHAVHILALGEDKTHKAFTNCDWDRVYAALKTLADTEDLDALIEQNAYEIKDQAQKTHRPVPNPGQKTRKANRQRTWSSKYERMSRQDDPGERKRLLYVITRLFDEPFITFISRDRFDRADWRILDIPDLTELRDILKTRLEQFIAKVLAGKIEYDFGFYIYNPRTGDPLAVKTIIAHILEQNRPVRMNGEAQGPVFICAPEGILVNATMEEDPF